jgi:hypothetical protein
MRAGPDAERVCVYSIREWPALPPKFGRHLDLRCEMQRLDKVCRYRRGCEHAVPVRD